MRRREFIALVGGAAVGLPCAARAQAPAKPVVGLLCGKTPEGDAAQLAPFWKGLNDSGFVEGNNIVAEYRWAQSDYSRFPALAAELITRKVDVIAGIGTTPAALAAKAATNAIPIVFIIGTDPIATGLVGSLNRPGSNITGVTFLNRTLVAKQFEVLHDMVLSASCLGFLINPRNPFAQADTQDARAALEKLGLQMVLAKSSSERELATALTTFDQQSVGGFVVAGDLFLNSQQARIIAHAAKHALPAVYPWREATEAGGLLSYGASRTEAYHQAGIYVGKILKGFEPAELPVQQVTKVELVLNLKTAKVLGLTFSLPLLGRADEVIE
ncbi:MAG TPA: ABC transporter substrate-binding protein [Xanthobacteraceae bacterium]|nr:ABC transporter substrate-binding protein [Xanthobacteraceae bacterium]